MKSIIALILASIFVASKAFQAKDIEQLTFLQNAIPENWKNLEFVVQAKDGLLQHIATKAQAINQIRLDSSGPLAEIQKFEQEFIFASQSGAPQTEIDARFNSLVEVQRKYDEQLREASRLIQLYTIDSELVEDVLLRNYALEACLLRRDHIATKLLLKQEVTYRDLEQERRSLTLTEEEDQADKSLMNATGEVIGAQMERYCGRRAEVLYAAVKSIVDEYHRQMSQPVAQPAVQPAVQPVAQGQAVDQGVAQATIQPAPQAPATQ